MILEQEWARIHLERMNEESRLLVRHLHDLFLTKPKGAIEAVACLQESGFFDEEAARKAVALYMAAFEKRVSDNGAAFAALHDLVGAFMRRG